MKKELKKGHCICKSEEVLLSGVRFHDRITGHWYQIIETDKMIDGKPNLVFAIINTNRTFPVSASWFTSLVQRETYTICEGA